MPNVSLSGHFARNVKQIKSCFTYKLSLIRAISAGEKSGRYEHHENPCFSYRLAGVRGTTIPPLKYFAVPIVTNNKNPMQQNGAF